MTLQLPNTTTKAGTAKMHSHRERREMHWCQASRSLNLHPMAESHLPSGTSVSANVISLFLILVFLLLLIFVCLVER